MAIQTELAYGPVNIHTGNSAQFVVEFLDTTGALTVPSSGTIFVTYTNVSAVSQTDTVSLAPSPNRVFTGTWSSTSATLGLATWTLTSANSTSILQTGLIRVVGAGV